MKHAVFEATGGGTACPQPAPPRFPHPQASKWGLWRACAVLRGRERAGRSRRRRQRVSPANSQRRLDRTESAAHRPRRSVSGFGRHVWTVIATGRRVVARGVAGSPGEEPGCGPRHQNRNQETATIAQSRTRDRFRRSGENRRTEAVERTTIGLESPTRSRVLQISISLDFLAAPKLRPKPTLPHALITTDLRVDAISRPRKSRVPRATPAIGAPDA